MVLRWHRHWDLLFGGASGATTQPSSDDGTGPSPTITDFLSEIAASASGPSSTVLDLLSQTTASISSNSPSLSISDPPFQFSASVSGSTIQPSSDEGAGPSPTISDPLSQMSQITVSASDSSEDAGLPAISDPLSQITASVSGVSVSSSPWISGSDGSMSLPILGPGSVASQPTATSAFSTTSASGGDFDSEAGLVLSLISKLADSLPTSIVAPPISAGSGSDPWNGSDGTNDFDDESPSHYVGHGLSAECTETYKVVSGDTCAAIINVFNLTAADFLTMNPTVGAACTNLEVEQEYCVQWGFRMTRAGDAGCEDEG